MSKIIYITGVSGVGKSTIGSALADKLKLPYLEGDDFHPESNILKMSSGNALNDDDRAPWLFAINQAARKAKEQNGAVISCSALKEKYRLILETEIPAVIWIHLLLDKKVIADRMSKRVDHFMPVELLDSQFETYEDPERGILITNDADTPEIIERITQALAKI